MERIAKMAERKAEEWGDPSMAQMFEDDARDYRQISELIKNGQLQPAARRMNYMDTAARDEIAIYVYDTVMKYY